MLLLRTLLLVLAPAEAVKDFLFRSCDQNPFCNRNRHYAQQATLPEFSSPYSIDSSSVDVSDATKIGAILKKVIKDQVVNLPVTIEVLSDNTVHLLIDEQGRKIDSSSVQSERFNPADFMLDPHREISKPQANVQETKSGFVVTFGAKRENKLIVTNSPFSIEVSHNGDSQISLNSRNLLNIEHLRKQDKEDEARLPWEVSTGAWEDEHDHKKDSKLRGPEAVALDINFEGYNYVYGIPEHADSLALRNTNGKADGDHKDPYRLYNVDIFEYETNSPLPMYGSIPFMVAHKRGASAGAFWLNAADTYVDIDKQEEVTNTHWISENGVLSLYMFVGNKPSEVVEAYGKLTGMATLPQQFAIGYHQCRWNYNSNDDVLDVNSQFDVHQIPYDVIWLDIEYTEHKKYFTWNKDQFPDQEYMMDRLDEARRKLVAIIDPHIKSESGYAVYENIKARSLAVKDSKGNPFHGQCWPGESVWIDTMNPEAWKYWRELFALGDELGGNSKNLHIWNDMNEPSVFDGPETSAPKNLIHHGGWEHRDVHNYYGMTVVNSTYDAMLSRYDNKQRPFILTRSYFAGSQRLGPTWTGDNQAKWEYLKIATPMVLTHGLAGMPFAGADVGGFFGNPEPELLTRWYQAGSFYPFFRGHAHIDARRREPYLPAEPYNTTIAAAIGLRYQLMPTFYTAFWESSQTLAPVLRPLFYETPNNEITYGIDDTFFVGDSLLAKPVTDAGVTSTEVYIPENQIYYNYWTGETVTGPTWKVVPVDIETIPLFARGGTIHARRDRPRRSTETMQNDPYTLVVAIGKDGTAKGKVYVDDGISFNYKDGDFVTTDITYSKGKITGSVTHAGKGTYKNIAIERIIVLGAQLTSAKVDSTGVSLDILPTNGGVIVRNPRVAIGSDWSITVT